MHDAEQTLGKRNSRGWSVQQDLMNNQGGGRTSLGNPVGEIVPATQEMELEVIDTSESTYQRAPTVDVAGRGTLDRGVAYNLRSRDVMRTNPHGRAFDEL